MLAVNKSSMNQNNVTMDKGNVAFGARIGTSLKKFVSSNNYGDAVVQGLGVQFKKLEKGGYDNIVIRAKQHHGEATTSIQAYLRAFPNIPIVLYEIPKTVGETTDIIGRNLVRALENLKLVKLNGDLTEAVLKKVTKG